MIGDYLIEFNNFKFPIGHTIFLQFDRDIWWVPKLKIRDEGFYIGWLFMQFGIMKFDSRRSEQ
jgi:hypothetical protein